MYDKETLKTQRRYDRFSRIYDTVEYLFETKLFRSLRKKTLSKLEGRVLEIGVGTGKNLKYYDRKAELTAIDLSPKMLEKAQARAKQLKIHVNLRIMDAQKMEFKDDSFDYVIGTFVLCSVPYPIKALKEIKRVTRKNGKIIFLEHVLSKNKLIALWEHIHNPITRWLFGFNVNRDTKQKIIKSGLKVDNDEKLAFFDVFRRFTCSK
ncbi:class I SAM-dependent methyltransferase [Candidatus Woesearchaeota archaeon]|nr:class I SAM-dependent methyltransferase [Candidatus Woesearchaeota archaeon]